MRSALGMAHRVAILGAGVMGVSLALLLARRGYDVSLFEREAIPLAGASRWNEGKIHLGYLYSADGSLETARRIIPGGLNFAPIIRELIGADIDPHVTTQDDVYLVHRRSVVNVDESAAAFENVSALLREHADAVRYLIDVSDACARRLSRSQLAGFSDHKDILAGFAVQERSINTQWVADRLCDALLNETRVRFFPKSDVRAAMPVDGADGPWRVHATCEGRPIELTFGLVVNALWHGRLAVDVTAGVEPEPGWSNRFRRSLFIKTRKALDLPNAIISFGPFGDIKNYDGRTFYISWYPAGLACDSHSVMPPEIASLDMAQQEELIRKVRTAMVELLPWAAEIFASAEEIVIGGGFVFAQGRGSLADPKATLHRRDRFGIFRRGSYYSVDTGKYSTAPWLARRLAEEICGG